MPVVTLALLAFGIAINVHFIRTSPAVASMRLATMYLCIVICSAAIIYGILDAWQNAGIVTRIDLTWPWLTWTKQTIFGVRERRWQADRITRVWVMSFGGVGNMLRIRRSNGFPLGAFGQQSKQDLEWAAGALRDALRAHGAAGGGAA
jgi:hypothetical protein